MKTRSRYRLLGGTAFLMLMGGVTYSCSDFLNVLPQGTVDEQTLTSQPGVEGTLLAAYRMLDCTTSLNDNWGCAASNWAFGSVPSDDAYKGSEATDQPEETDIELYNWLTSGAQSYLNVKWRASYEGVFRSNATLRLLRKVQTEKPTEISTADANGIAGEALFLRAHYHFEAYRMWQHIPYYFTDDTTDFHKTNVGVNAVANILKDLDSAIVLLPTGHRNGQVGRSTKWTARAYKGRVQVYAGMYDSALVTLRNVRTAGPFALETSSDHVWTGFSQFANGKETILAYQASANDGEPDGNNANYGERLNFPHSGSPFGCCGFHQPSQNLVNFYRVDSITGLPLAVTDPTWNANNATFTSADSLVPVDPRLDWTVGRDGVPYKDWGPHEAGWIRAPAYGGPYSPKKNVHERTSGAQSKVGWLPAQLNSVKIHMFRYADMLLLLAEANVEATTGGSLTEAAQIVNEIRARAGKTAQGCGAGSSDSLTAFLYPACAAGGGDDRIAVPLIAVSATFDTLTEPWARYKIGLYPVPFPDVNYARRAVRFERRLELAMEGQRFFDLRRWGATIDSVIPSFITIESGRRAFLGAAAPFVAKHHLYPIPTIQIELSQVGTQSALCQNAGWGGTPCP